jgi:hypothetical protein
MARLIQLSLIAYFSAGAFLSLSYYDYYWQLIAIIVIINTLVNENKGDTIDNHSEKIPFKLRQKKEAQPFVRPCKK